MAVISKDLGPITAYAAAVNRGYTGTREEFETLMASYATVAEQAGESAESAEESAASAAQSAASASQSAQNAEGSRYDALLYTNQANGYKNTANTAAQAAKDARDAAQSAQTAAEAAQAGAEAAVDGFDDIVTAAISDVNAAGTNQKELAKRQAEKSEAWAVGKINGEDVGVSDPAYHNNAKYYAESAGTSVTTATTKASEAAQSASGAAASAAAAEDAADRAEEAARTLTIDDTLTQAGQAADAKAVGDEISDLKSDLTQLTTTTEVTNYADISSESFITATADVVETYNDDGSVTLTFTQTANPVVIYRLDGLTAGKTYDLSFDLLSGNISSASKQKVGIYSSGASLQRTIATATKTDSTYTIEFTAENYTLALQLELTNSSKNVTIGNIKINESGDVSKLIIKNDALSDELIATVQMFPNDIITIREDVNMLNGIALTNKTYINGTTGVKTATGSAMSATDFIPVEEGVVYYWNDIINGYFAFYSDASEASYVYGETYHDKKTTGWFKAPSTAKYVRVTINNSQIPTAWINTINKAPLNKDIKAFKNVMLSYDVYPTNPCDYDGKDITIFHKILCIGDSLTQGVCNYTENGQNVSNVTFPNYSYPTYLGKITGCEVTNKGSAGKTTAQWYSYFADADLSGYDCAIINLGVNDALTNHEWTQEESDALDNIIAKLKAENTNIKIFVSTTIPAISYTGSYFDLVNNGLRSYVEALNDADVVLVDLAQYGHTGEYLAYNAGHLTAYGYYVMACDYISAISFIVKTHNMDYRFIQFIGTDHALT